MGHPWSFRILAPTEQSAWLLHNEHDRVKFQLEILLRHSHPPPTLLHLPVADAHLQQEPHLEVAPIDGELGGGGKLESRLHRCRYL